MQALWFLTTRSFINGVKRAVTSGRRLVTLLFALGYYVMLVFRPFSSQASTLNPKFHPLYFSRGATDSIVFGFFVLMSGLLTLSFLSPKGGFRQADVDVLFATPVSPKHVLILRLIRDYLITLITPTILLLFGGRNAIMAVRGFMGGMRDGGTMAGRLGSTSWLLMSFAFVSVSYALSFFVNRSDLQADRNKKILSWVGGIAMLSTILFVSLSFRWHPGVDTLINCAQSPFLRVVYFPSTAATWMVSGAYADDILWAATGAAVLIALGIFGIWAAMTQIPYMYDQAAVKGFGTAELRVMRRNNDTYGMRAQMAKEGKVKIDPVSRFFSNLRFSGASALVWREIVLQIRGAGFIFVFLGPVVVLMSVIPVATLPRSVPSESVGSVVIFMQLMGVMMMTMNSAVSGFMELLKRVDFQKPLPFRPAGTVFWEVASKCIPNLIFGVLATVVVSLIRFDLWTYALASVLLVLGMSLLVSATVFLVTIGFPDAGDASQRGFRGILTLIGMVIFGLPGAGAFASLHYLLHVDPTLAALPACAICVGITVVISYFAGILYESYNPSE